MLDESQLERLFEQYNIPVCGQTRIHEIRQNAPRRRTSGADKSVKVRYASLRMGFVLEAEAFHTEYAAIRTFDYDPGTFEIYPQPTILNISYRNPNGRLIGVSITPDLFLIGQDGFSFIECKTEEDLLKLSIRAPERFVKEGSRWRSPPAEAVAAEFGCEFRIRSSAENNWVLISNLEFLEDYMGSPGHEPDSQLGSEILAMVAKQRRITTGAIIEQLNTPSGADAIYGLIARNQVYFDLFSTRLAQPETAWVYHDELTAQSYRHIRDAGAGRNSGWAAALQLQPGRQFCWDGQYWEIINVGEQSVFAREAGASGSKDALIELRAEHLEQLCRTGVIQALLPADREDPRKAERDERLRSLARKDMETANMRYSILFKGESGAACERTRKHWKHKYREAERQYGLGWLGLVPDPGRRRGNRQSRLPVEVEEEIERIVDTLWLTPSQPSMTYCHGLLKSFCDKSGYPTPTRKTFARRLRRGVDHKDTIRRIGRKRAYQDEVPYLAMEYTTPPHGERPFHIAHIDHTPIDLVLLDGSLESVVKQAWLTLMVDAYSRMIIAWYLTFDKPSYRSCMMVVRECVRQHGRLPQFIVSDQGSDFRSVYYENLLAQFGVHKKERPTGKSRHGSIIERIFNTTQSQFIHNLMGNTKAWRHFRQVGRDVSPERLARWTFAMLDEKLGEYFTQVYHQNHHVTLGMSPQQKYQEGLRFSGLREHRFIPFDSGFIANTCPSTAKGVARVSPRGVKIHYRYFTCDAILGSRHHGCEYPVRYDPFNMNRGYIFVDGRWHDCLAYDSALMPVMSERAMKVATATLKVKYRTARNQAAMNAARLAEYLQSAEQDMALMAQMLRDRESATVVARLSRPPEVMKLDQSTPVVMNEPPAFIPNVLETF